MEGVLVERELLGRRQKEAAGGYRSRAVEAVLVEIELRGGGGGSGKQKEAAGGYRSRSRGVEGVLLERQLRGEQRGVVRGAREEGRKGRSKEWDSV